MTIDNTVTANGAEFHGFHIHANNDDDNGDGDTDDFGKHAGVGTSATTGNAGFRYACGEIVPTAGARAH